MSPIGCHALVFSGVFDREGLDRSARITAESGFDLLELVLMDPFNFDIATAKDVLSGYDLTLAASMGLNAHTDVSSQDPEIVARGGSHPQQGPGNLARTRCHLHWSV